MTEFLTSPYFVLFARCCVGGVFVVSGLGKLADGEGTVAAMSRYPFLPRGSGGFLGRVFPYLELVIGVMLVLGLLARVAAVGAVLLFVVFTALVVYDLTRGQQQSCHCFGRISAERLTPVAVVRNLLLLGLSALVAASFDGLFSLDGPLNNATNGSLHLLAAPAQDGTLAESMLVIMLSLLGVAVVAYGEQAVATVRGTLRGTGSR
ncbi:MAG TPA: DoxX family protein [Chloroflexia bacterium]|nr:DoxX family protein [Chloroflexia bacterium]